MRRKAFAWALFLASILLLSLAVTPYSRAADAAIISLRLTLLIVLSILIVRERWKSQGEPGDRAASANSGVGARFLRNWRCWHYGDEQKRE